MSAHHPYKTAGIVAVIYFSLLALLGLPSGLCFLVFSNSESWMILISMILIGVPILGIIASSYVISRGPNKLSTGAFLFFTLIFASGVVLYIAAFHFDRIGPHRNFATSMTLIFMLHSGLFGWLTYSMWRNRRNPEKISEVFDEKE